MRKSLIAMLMLLTLTAGNEAMAQKHRHNPNITLNVQDPSTGQNAQVNIQVDDNDSTGIVAYSDTTGVDTAAIDNVPATSNWDDFDFEDDDFVSALKNILGIGVGGAIGVGGVILAIILCLFVLLLLLAPIIAIIVVVWIIVRNRNQRLKLAEKAMESGQPIPQEALKPVVETDDELWNKGIRNLFLGLGLIACGYFLIGDLLQGFGVVLAFYGAGQALIARSSKNKKKKEDELNIGREIKENEEK